MAKVGIALLAAVMLCGCGRPEKTALSVYVAASLQNAMAELAPAYEAQSGVKLTFNFGGSGTLEQQIKHGAPADVFLSAAPKPMDELAGKDMIEPGTRRDLLRNELVLIVPKGSKGPNSFPELTGANVKLIALGEPSSVPAGDYGRQTMEALHIWDAVQSKLVLAKDVRQVLTYVETGNAEAGIVYATDAHELEKVRVAAIAPADSHAPVLYPVAVIKGSRNGTAARAFLTFLASDTANAIFVRHGFTTVRQ